MRAAVMRDRALVVADVPVAKPEAGEVLVRTRGFWTSSVSSTPRRAIEAARSC
jgi:hypothetical protein